METPPPRWLRRLGLAPLVFVGALCLTLLSPALHLVAALADLAFDRRRWRVTRFVGLGLAFCVVEVFGLFTLLTVWFASGFGLFMKRPRWIRANTIIIGQYLELITRAVRFYLGFTFSYSYDPIPRGAQLLFSRHAGPGDAYLIARVVVRDLGRRLHMVGAAKLQWDPFLDIAGERLGFHYLHQNPTDAAVEIDRIKELSAGLDADETLVIFPEGGNYTPGRRQRSIERLQARGQLEEARRAEALRHTLPPRFGGVCAAIEGAPDATVVFVAHAGLDGLYGFSDLWASVPLKRDVSAHGWSAPIESRPAERSDQRDWLFDQWVSVDEWIESAYGAMGSTGGTTFG